MQVEKLFAQKKKKPYRKIVVTFTRQELTRYTVLGIEYLISSLKNAGIPIIRGILESDKFSIGVSYGSFERFDNVNTNIVVFTWISDKLHIKKARKEKKNFLTQGRRIRV